jgi:hypothetical protein
MVMNGMPGKIYTHEASLVSTDRKLGSSHLFGLEQGVITTTRCSAALEGLEMGVVVGTDNEVKQKPGTKGGPSGSREERYTYHRCMESLFR